jgi:hypothetical protein
MGLYFSFTPLVLASFFPNFGEVKHLFLRVDPIPEQNIKWFTKHLTSQREGGGRILKGQWKYCPDLKTITFILAGNQAETSRWIEAACQILRGRSGPTSSLERVSYEWEWGQELTITMEEVMNRDSTKQGESIPRQMIDSPM